MEHPAAAFITSSSTTEYWALELTKDDVLKFNRG